MALRGFPALAQLGTAAVETVARWAGLDFWNRTETNGPPTELSLHDFSGDAHHHLPRAGQSDLEGHSVHRASGNIQEQIPSTSQTTAEPLSNTEEVAQDTNNSLEDTNPNTEGEDDAADTLDYSDDESVFSVFSNVSLLSSNSSITPEDSAGDSFLELFLSDKEVENLCRMGLEMMPAHRFGRNLRRVLKSYSRCLKQESRSPIQNQASMFVGFRAAKLADLICRAIKGQPTQALLLETDYNRRALLNEYLDSISDASGFDIDRPSSDNSELLDSEFSDSEDEDFASEPLHIELGLRKFLLEGPPFQQLKDNLSAFLNRPQLSEVDVEYPVALEAVELNGARELLIMNSNEHCPIASLAAPGLAPPSGEASPRILSTTDDNDNAVKHEDSLRGDAGLEHSDYVLERSQALLQKTHLTAKTDNFDDARGRFASEMEESQKNLESLEVEQAAFEHDRESLKVEQAAFAHDQESLLAQKLNLAQRKESLEKDWQTLSRERDEVKDQAKYVETEKENLENHRKEFTKSRKEIENQIEAKQVELRERETELTWTARAQDERDRNLETQWEMLDNAKKELDKKGQSLKTEMRNLMHDKKKLKSAEQDPKSAMQSDPARQSTPLPQGHSLRAASPKPAGVKLQGYIDGKMAFRVTLAAGLCFATAGIVSSLHTTNREATCLPSTRDDSWPVVWAQFSGCFCSQLMFLVPILRHETELPVKSWTIFYASMSTSVLLSATSLPLYALLPLQYKVFNSLILVSQALGLVSQWQFQEAAWDLKTEMDTDTHRSDPIQHPMYGSGCWGLCFPTRQRRSYSPGHD